MRRSRRPFVVAAIAFSVALIPACSAGTAPGSSSAANPSSTAQATARLLAAGKTKGFLVARADAPGNPVKAAPFVPPSGSLDHVCTLQMSPQLFMPSPSVGTGESLSLPVREQRRYLPLPPTWFELINVYPGTEAAGIVKALPALIGKCGHFVFAGSGASIAARESAVPLAGYGGQALYVSVRLAAAGKSFADDWIVIRSDRTLIFIDGQYVRPVGSAQDRMTLQLAKEAWQRYSAA